MVFKMNIFIKGLMQIQSFDKNEEKRKAEVLEDMMSYILYQAETQEDIKHIKPHMLLNLLNYKMKSDSLKDFIEKAETKNSLKRNRLL